MANFPIAATEGTGRAGQADRVLIVRGDLDSEAAPRLAADLAVVLAERPVSLALDLAEVRSLDPPAIDVLRAAKRRADRLGVELVLSMPSPASWRALKRADLVDVFPIRP